MVSPLALVQIAGYIANSDVQMNSDNISDILEDNLIGTICNIDNVEEFIQTQNIYQNKENSILKSIKEAKVPSDEIFVSSAFSGYIMYLWAYLNQHSNNSIQNFENLVNMDKFDDKVFKSDGSFDEEKSNSIKDFNRRITEGNIYKLISQTTSSLKQISRLCDFALNHKDLYPDTKYWQNLKKTTQKALTLTKLPPLDEII